MSELLPQHRENSQTEDSKDFIRSSRDLESYKRVFGEEFGRKTELILDIGAGDATMADEIESLSDHKAKVIRFDRDYSDQPPEGNATSVAGDATSMPYKDSSFDRIVSHNVMYYLGREKGVEAVSEILRVLKVGGEALVYPSNPFKGGKTEISHKVQHLKLNYPTLVITKPNGFEDLSENQKKQIYAEVVRAISLGKTATNLIKWGITKASKQKGTYRTVESDSTYRL